MVALKLNCLESLTAIGIGVGACALAPLDMGLTAGAVIGGAGLFARIRENSRKAGLDDGELVARMQKRILREWDHWQDTQERRDAVTLADAGMTKLLPQVMLTREELAATAIESAQERYPAMAARKVVDRLGELDTDFCILGDGSVTLARQFALEVIERALSAAKEDKDYAIFLTLDIAIELGRAIAETLATVRELAAKVEAGFAAVRRELPGNELTRLSEQALRGAVARFVTFRPEATSSQVVEAIEHFVPEYEALRERVATLDATDNRIRGAQQSARQALEDGDLDSARRYLAEAGEARIDKAADAVREAAESLIELAEADLLALDWESADANWNRAATMLAPFDARAAEALEIRAADKLQSHSDAFGAPGALLGAIRYCRRLKRGAEKRSDGEAAAGFSAGLGNALSMQGARTQGAEGLALLAEAVTAYQASLVFFTKQDAPMKWARVQRSLGIAYATQGERTGGKDGLTLLANAVAAYNEALTILTRKAAPDDWGRVQNSLGNALRRQGERNSGEAGLVLLANSVKAYRAALAVRKEHTFDWAITQTNLGAALQTQGERLGGRRGRALLAKSVEACRAASLTVLTKEKMPARWVPVQNVLANTLYVMGERTKGKRGPELLAEAVSTLRAVLTVQTARTMPTPWAMSQHNLGNALVMLGIRTGGQAGLDLLDDAVTALSAALTVRTEAAMPVPWAFTMQSLAGAEESVADLGTEPAEHLRAAEAALLCALRVYTPEHTPYYHESATTSLARIRAKLAALDSPAAP